MSSKIVRFTVLLACVLIAGAAMGWAQDKGKTETTAPKMSPEEQAMMERMMTLAQPGPQHKLLAKYVGKWTTAMTMAAMDPKAPPTQAQGTAELEMLLGGRYLEQKVRGDINGMPYEGIGITGFDNSQQKYISYWIDNMGTMQMTATGTADSTGRVITMFSIYDDPMTGEKNKKSRQVLRLVSDDEIDYEMYDTRQGKEMKMFDMVYKRVK